MTIREQALAGLVKSADTLEGYGVPVKRTVYKSPNLSVLDKIKAFGIRYLPNGLRGSAIVNSYINGKGGGGGDLAKVICNQPGATTAVMEYLQKHPEKIGLMAAKSMEGKWHGPVTGSLAKLFGKTDFGRGIMLNGIINEMLPTIDGDKSYAMECLAGR